MNTNSREAILAAAKKAVQKHGYNGLNFRDIAAEVGIKASSIYHHFAGKSDLGVAVARRYWEDAAANLESIFSDSSNPIVCLRKYPDTFRVALATGNRMCLCSFLASEYDDLPADVQKEVQKFTNVNINWLSKILLLTKIVEPGEAEHRAFSIFSAISGAQLVARGRADISLYDSIIESYRSSGLLP